MSRARWMMIFGALLVALVLLIVGGGLWLYEEARGPEIADGMQWQRDCCNVDSPYDAQLRRIFPAGSSEQDLRETLERQGFEFGDGRRAVARWSDLVCGYFANVEWEADEAGRVTAVSGDYGSACL